MATEEPSGGPQRTEHVKGSRQEKPYTRKSGSGLKRAPSFLDSFTTLVAKPFNWLTNGSAPASHSPKGNSTAVNGSLKSKRRSGSPGGSSVEPTPKKRRRAASPSSPADVSNRHPIRPSLSVPQLSSASAAIRPSRSAFLPPLPRANVTPSPSQSRQGSVDPMRYTSPALTIRASPAVGSSVFIGRGTTPQPLGSSTSFNDMTAFGLRYTSPFVSRASPDKQDNISNNHSNNLLNRRSISRQPSLYSDRGGSLSVSILPKPRTHFAEDDGASQRGDSVSPTRPNFSPAASPMRKLSDGTGSTLIPPFQATSLRRSGSSAAPSPDASQTTFPRSQSLLSMTNGRSATTPFGRQPSVGPLNSHEALLQANRAVAHISNALTTVSPSASFERHENGEGTNERRRASSPEKMSTDRIFQALEESMPWSEGRKIRMGQKAKVRVPSVSAPSTSRPVLGARTARMVKPYSREVGVGTEDMDIDSSALAVDADANPTTQGKKKKNILASLEEKRSKALERVVEESMSMEEPKIAASVTKTTKVPKETNPFKKPADPIALPAFIPPVGSSALKDQLEAAEPLPFAIVASSPTSSMASTTISGKVESSSLRAGRTKSKTVHAPSASLTAGRPGGDKKSSSNRFAIDDEDEDGMGGEMSEAEKKELDGWASKNTATMNIPSGFSFGGASFGGTLKSGEEGGKTPKPAPFPKMTPPILKAAEDGASEPLFPTSASSPFATPFQPPKTATTENEAKATPSPFAPQANGGSTFSLFPTLPSSSSAPGPSPFTGFGSAAAAPSKAEQKVENKATFTIPSFGSGSFAGFGAVPSTSNASLNESKPAENKPAAPLLGGSTSFGAPSSSAPPSNLFGSTPRRAEQTKVPEVPSSSSSNPFGTSALTSTPFGASGLPSFGGAAGGASPFASIFGNAPASAASTAEHSKSAGDRVDASEKVEPVNSGDAANPPTSFGSSGTKAPSTSLFGNGTLFGAKPAQSSEPGAATSTTPPGAIPVTSPPAVDSAGSAFKPPSIFGGATGASSGSLFGSSVPASSTPAPMGAGAEQPKETPAASLPTFSFSKPTTEVHTSSTPSTTPPTSSTPATNPFAAASTTSLFGQPSSGASSPSLAPVSASGSAPLFGGFGATKDLASGGAVTPAAGMTSTFKVNTGSTTSNPFGSNPFAAPQSTSTNGAINGNSLGMTSSTSNPGFGVNGGLTPSTSFTSNATALPSSSSFGNTTNGTPSFTFGSQSTQPPRSKTPPTMANGDSAMETSPVHRPAPANPPPTTAFAFGQTQTGGSSNPTTPFGFGPSFAGGAAPASGGTAFAFGSNASGSRPATPSSPFLTPFAGANGAAAPGVGPASPFTQSQQLHPPPPPTPGAGAPAFSFNFGANSPAPSPVVEGQQGQANMFQFGAGVTPGDGSAAGSPITPRRTVKALPRRGTSGRR